MSQAVRIAVATLLKNDAGLKAQLAPHPSDGGLPAIFNARKSEAPPVYDCLTYRVSQASPDGRFRPPVGMGRTDVEDFYVDFEGWTDHADSAPIEAIGERLDALFDNRAFDAPPDGYVFRAERVLAETDLYDTTLRAWFGLFRYRLRLQRGPAVSVEIAEPMTSADALDTH